MFDTASVPVTSVPMKLPRTTLKRAVPVIKMPF